MKKWKAVVVSLVFTCAAVVTPLVYAQGGHKDHVMVSPKDLKWADVPSLPPGAKIAVLEGPMNEAKPFTIRLKFPANYKIPPHFHTGIEHVTVLSGTLHMGLGDKFDEKKGTALGAGHFGMMQPNTKHYAWTKEETIAQIHGTGPWTVTYVNSADDPRKKAQ
jgi:anti-sigma factor ChrR (cupin superfamily)